MNRRSFLRLAGIGAAGMALDPERLLWVPGQKTFFLPTVKPYVTIPGTWGYTTEMGSLLKQYYDKALLTRLLPNIVFATFNERKEVQLGETVVPVRPAFRT